jgi:hypothetical protein
MSDDKYIDLVNHFIEIKKKKEMHEIKCRTTADQLTTQAQNYFIKDQSLRNYIHIRNARSFQINSFDATLSISFQNDIKEQKFDFTFILDNASIKYKEHIFPNITIFFDNVFTDLMRE